MRKRSSRARFKCWGASGMGQLGSADYENTPQPIDVKGLISGSRISAGSGHTCGVLTSGNAYC